MQGLSLRKIFTSGSSSLRRFEMLSRSSIYSTNQAYNFSFDPRQGQRPHHPQPNRQPNQQPNQPPPQKSGRSSTKMLLLALAAVSGFGLSYYQSKNQGKPQEKQEPEKREVTSAPSNPKIGGSWRLVDLKGDLVTEKDFEGSYYLLYFGFCSCPDVCPQTLTSLSKAVKILKEDPSFPSKKLKTIFVSFDPDRDTPEKMERFLGLFENDIVGLRGLSNNDPHLKEMLKKYKILVLKLGSTGIVSESSEETEDKKAHYNLDHTVVTYLMDKKNNCISILSPTMTGVDMAENIKKAVQENK